MTDLELLGHIADRERQGLSTTRVTMSPKDASELRDTLTGKPTRALVEPGTRVRVLGVDIWVDEDLPRYDSVWYGE